MTKIKLLVIGHARHGKDTVSELINKRYGLTFQSSSYFCAEEFIFDELKYKYNYSSVQECYDDRHSHRDEWYNLIRWFNRNDDAALGKRIFEKYDVYCGLRDKDECQAIVQAGVVDAVVWVDRSRYLPLESQYSMTLTPAFADYVIDNNGTLEDLEANTVEVIDRIFSSKQTATRKTG